METKSFTYGGTPVTAGLGKNEKPYVIFPDPRPSISLKVSVVDLIINFKGSLIIRVLEQLVDGNGDVISEASPKAREVVQTSEDFDYFYDLIVGDQSLGDSISKQLVNGILEDSPMGINCYSWTGEFLLPITLSAEYAEGKIVVSLLEHDNAIDKEYSFDRGLTWQLSNELLSPTSGDYNIIVRYLDKELRKGKSFKSVQEVIITIPESE